MIRTCWIAGIILMFGLLVRFYRIDQPLLEFFPERQTQTAEITRNIAVNGWKDFWTPKVRYFTGSPIPYVLEFPLYNGIVAVLYQLFGLYSILGRLASLFFFILSSIVFYKLASPDHQAPDTRYQALFPLLFFVFSPLHILVSRSFQPDELALFLLLLAVWKTSWAVFAIAVLVKLPIALFTPVMFFSSSLRGAKQRSNLAEGDTNIVSLGSSTRMLTRNDIKNAILSLLPSLIWYFRASRLTIHPAIVRNFDFFNWFQPQLLLKTRWYFSLFQIEHIWVLTTMGLLCVWLGTWQLKNYFKIWTVWLISGMLYVSIFNYHTMTHEYYHLLLLPPLAALAGHGTAQLARILSPRRVAFRMIAQGGLLMLLVGNLLSPALAKITRAPTSLSDSDEIPPLRYKMITEPKNSSVDASSPQIPSPSTSPTDED